MADFTGLIEIMKQAALDAVNASNPVNIMFGKVANASPLQIDVEQKMTLGESQLILARSVTEHTIEMTISHQTEMESEHVHNYYDSDTGEGASGSADRDSGPTQHLHRYAGRKSFTVHNGLVVGDEVILARLQGGQKFIVIDRLG